MLRPLHKRSVVTLPFVYASTASHCFALLLSPSPSGKKGGVASLGVAREAYASPNIHSNLLAKLSGGWAKPSGWLAKLMPPPNIHSNFVYIRGG